MPKPISALFAALILAVAVVAAGPVAAS